MPFWCLDLADLAVILFYNYFHRFKFGIQTRYKCSKVGFRVSRQKKKKKKRTNVQTAKMRIA